MEGGGGDGGWRQSWMILPPAGGTVTAGHALTLSSGGCSTDRSPAPPPPVVGREFPTRGLLTSSCFLRDEVSSPPWLSSPAPLLLARQKSEGLLYSTSPPRSFYLGMAWPTVFSRRGEQPPLC